MTTETPLTSPALLQAPTPEAVAGTAQRALDEVRGLLEEILAAEGRRTVANTLVPYDRLLLRLVEVADQGDDLSNLHPDPAMREAGEEVHLQAKALETDLALHRGLYETFAALAVSDEDPEVRYAVEKILRDFRQAGVDRDEATRARVKTLRDEIVAVGQAFDRTIREDVRTIRVRPEELEGLPDDFLEAHPPDGEGLVTVTTNYPDLFPVLKYASRADVRRRLMEAYLNRGHPKNLETLTRLLVTRHELARLLGYAHYAAYVTEDKMIGSGDAAQAFVDRVATLAEARARRDYEALLGRKRRDEPDAPRLEPWDRFYFAELLRAEEHGVDPKVVRAYFPFQGVLQGVLDLTSRLFGVRYEPVEASLWHPSVRTYDVHEDDRRIGRVYLDLHPREGKYTHAASAGVVRGTNGVQLPQALLMCNFPEPEEGNPALLEYSEVVTFFHEFGHLLHTVLSGRVRYGVHAMDQLEWDFIEVPSQLLEEWTKDPEALGIFARHHRTGEPIPPELVERMAAADAVARGLHVRRQMALAALSLSYYNRDPAGIDTTALAREVYDRYDPIPWWEGTHFQCGFGHLNGYSAIYYTYMWSLVIAKDLFGRFQRAKSLLDPKVARAYRKAVLDRGSSRPAADLVRAFLGREQGFEAFETWLREGLNGATP